MDKLQKLMNSVPGLIISAIVPIGAGLFLVIEPENTHVVIIVGIGIAWILKGIVCLYQLYINLRDGTDEDDPSND